MFTAMFNVKYTSSLVEMILLVSSSQAYSMSNSSFAYSSNVFGFVAGGISLLGFMIALCRPHLPSNKIKTLENLLHETENTFNEAVEAGLLVHEFEERTQHRLIVWVLNNDPSFGCLMVLVSD